MSRNIGILVFVFLTGMAGGIFADQIVWPYFVERPILAQYGLGDMLSTIEIKNIQKEAPLSNIMQDINQSIAGIRTKTSNGEVLEGSGIMVTSDGLMVTLASLVPQGGDYGFFVNGKRYSYQILKRDFDNDLALVKLGEINFSVSGFADLNSLELGDKVFLSGVVFSDSDGEVMTNISVNEGIIKSINQENIFTNIMDGNIMCGSTLFNSKGEIIGINNINPQGFVTAFSINKIKEFVGL